MLYEVITFGSSGCFTVADELEIEDQWKHLWRFGNRRDDIARLEFPVGAWSVEVVSTDIMTRFYGIVPIFRNNFV